MSVCCRMRGTVRGRDLRLSEQMDAWVIMSSQLATLSSSSDVSSMRLLFCE